MGTILVICTGNICRSPMASGLLESFLRDRGVNDVTVESCGVAAWDGSPATPEGIEAMREQGFDISGHVARKMNRPMIESADLIVGMASEHREAVKRIAPDAAGRAFTLKELVYLLHSAELPEAGTQKERLRSATVMADMVRRQHPDLPLEDEDVADPLGLGLETFRAIAWEIGSLCESLVDAVFVSDRHGERAERAGSAGEGRTGAEVGERLSRKGGMT